MKNKEKYFDEILEITIKDGYWAVDKNTNEPMFCGGINCPDCLFSGRCNSDSLREWLQAEYQEPIRLTDDEIVILKNIDKEFQWIARDENELLYCSTQKPFRNKEMKCWAYGKGYCTSLTAFKHLFKFVQWSDKEPYNIDELLKQNGVER